MLGGQTNQRLATLLSSLIERRWVGLYTLFYVKLYSKMNDVTDALSYSRLKQDYISDLFCKQPRERYKKLHLEFAVNLSYT